jgi:hypothetical protein
VSREKLRSDRLAARRHAAPPPNARSGAEVVDLQQQVQGDGGEHQRGNDRHEQSPSVRRCVARAKDGERMLQRGCNQASSS